MATRKFYSTREKKHWKFDARKKQFWSWGYDIRLEDGRRKREAGFENESDAAAAVGQIRAGEKDKRFGFLPSSAVPPFAELITKRLAAIKDKRERTRATRVLNTLLKLLPAKIKITDVTTPHLQRYVDERDRDGLKPQSIDRELNIVAATFNAAATYYPQLAQWKPPAVPRPKVAHGKRERLITLDERTKVIGYLLASQSSDETAAAARCRRQVGLQLQFLLLTGLRHGEMDHIKKSDMNWTTAKVKILGTKTQYRHNPTRYVRLPETALSILREFYDHSKTNYVFTRSGATIPHFYQILRAACEAVGVSYGKNTEGGFVPHDARHTATTELLDNTIPGATVQNQMGWSDKAMLLYYSHPTPAAQDKAAQVLEAYAGDSHTPVAQLDAALIEALSALVVEGKLPPLSLARIIRGEELISKEILEEITAFA